MPEVQVRVPSPVDQLPSPLLCERMSPAVQALVPYVQSAPSIPVATSPSRVRSGKGEPDDRDNRAKSPR